MGIEIAIGIKVKVQEMQHVRVGTNPSHWAVANKNTPFVVKLTPSEMPEDYFFDIDDKILSARNHGAHANTMDETQTDTVKPLFIWLNPQNKEISDAKQGRSAQIQVNLLTMFGNELFQPVVDGTLVCEIYLLGCKRYQDVHTGVDGKKGASTTEIKGMPVPGGIALGRYTITCKKEDTGQLQHCKAIEPFQNREVMLDYIMSFVEDGYTVSDANETFGKTVKPQQESEGEPVGSMIDNGTRLLQLNYFAPDEVTHAWHSVATVSFPVHYRFTSVELEKQNMRFESGFRKLGIKERFEHIKGLLDSGNLVAAFEVFPQNSTIMNGGIDTPPLELAKDRSLYLFNDKDHVFYPPEQSRDTKTSVALQEAIRRQLDSRMGSGA